MEQFIAPVFTPGELNLWLELGYRHFGTCFFRPLCGDCARCLPIRIPVVQYRHSRSARRLLSRNRGLTVKFTKLAPTEETYSLYALHKLRFGDEGADGFESYADAFFSDTPCSGAVCLYDGKKLISVSHIDMTGSVLSAVYCYYHDGYAGRSLGTFSILAELDAALEYGLDYVYLGYFIGENRHMKYKKRFYPNEVLITEGRWVPFTDRENRPCAPVSQSWGFLPRTRMGG